MKWHELLAHVPAALAEEIASQLIEAGASAVERRDDRSGVTVLITHFPVVPGVTARLLAAEATLANAGIPGREMTVRLIEDVDWIAVSRRGMNAQSAGERLWIRPPWWEEPTPPGRVEIVLEPGRAFGTGRHPSTRLCAEGIERLCGERAPRRFLDLGCGSGILSAVALKLGANRCLALDIDPDAVESARDLALRNGLSRRMQVKVGTLERGVVGAWWGRVDLLAANIFLGPLCEFAPRMRAVLSSGGRGILGGIGYEQAEPLREAVEGAGLLVRRCDRLEEWAALEIEKS